MVRRRFGGRERRSGNICFLKKRARDVLVGMSRGPNNENFC